MPNKKIEERFAEAIQNLDSGKPILLIGNGINRVNPESLSWEGVLKSLIEKSGVKNVRIGSKPLTFLFEEISHKMEGGATRENICRLKKHVRALIETKIKHGRIHEKFTSLPVENILTTNYDYCLEKSLNNDFVRQKINREKNADFKKYSLVTHNEVQGKSIWHIHGELCNDVLTETGNEYSEQSIMLGFDQYLAYVDKILKVFIEHANGKETGMKNEKPGLDKTWLSFFFTHDIHIIGLEFGLFESHLWAILNFRAKLLDRNKCIHNNIFYYIPSYELLVKRDNLELLESLKINIEPVTCIFNNGNFYEDFYDEVYNILQKKLSSL
ncbi:MAG: SIR2 family protein [Ginsengibacter sp.]